MGAAILIVFISLIGSVAMAMSWEIPVICTALPMLISGIVAGVNAQRFKIRNNRSLYLLTYLFIVFFMVYEVKKQNIALMGMDWYGYSYRAEINLMSGRIGLGLLFSNVTGDLFAKLVSILYQIFGVYPRMVHCYIFMVSQLLINSFQTFNFTFFENRKCAEKVALLLSITPVFIIHSIAFLREIPIAFFYVWSLKYFYKYLREGKSIEMLKAVILAGISAILHSGMIIVIFAYLVSIVFYSPRTKHFSVKPFSVVLVTIAFLLIFSSPIGQSMLSKFGELEESEILQTISNHVTTEATTSYISDTPSSMRAMILQTPYRTLLFELVPLPWQIRGGSTALSWLLDGTVRMVIFYWLMRLLFSLKKLTIPTEKKALVFVLLFIWIGFGILCGWGTSTYGTAIRHRVKILPTDILLAYLSYNVSRGEIVSEKN